MELYRVNSLGGTFQPGRAVPLHVRNRITELFAEGQAYSQISHETKIHISTIKRIIVQYANTGSFSPNKSSGRKRSVCTNEIIQFIEYLKFSRPTIYAEEIRREIIALGVINIPAVTTNDVIRNQLGLTYKKIQAVPVESQRDDIKQKIVEFMVLMSETNPARLHFFDESSVVRTSGNRFYGHSVPGKPAYEIQRYASNATYTVNLLHSMFGVDHYNILQGASNQLEMLHFLDECLQQRGIYDNPKIRRGDTIVMDNCGMHHGRLATEMLNDLSNMYGIRFIYQPPYSPDFNTCEFCFRSMKCQLRENSNFTEHYTELAISFALENITPEFSHRVFRHCGYLL